MLPYYKENHKAAGISAAFDLKSHLMPNLIWIKFWFPLWVYSAIIFFLSAQPAGSSSLPFVIWDKMLHVVEFMPFGLLAIRGFCQQGVQRGHGWLLATVLGLLYGLTDEFHQHFSPGREVSLFDVLADTLGAALGAALYIAYITIRKR